MSDDISDNGNSIQLIGIKLFLLNVFVSKTSIMDRLIENEFSDYYNVRYY